MSNESGLNDQVAGEDFVEDLMAAFDSGNQADIDRLMRQTEGKELEFKSALEDEAKTPPAKELESDTETEVPEGSTTSDTDTEVPEDKPAEKPADNKDEAEPIDPNELKRLVEAERRRAQLFEHRARSDAGRVSALQRRIDELTSQLEKAKPQEATPPAAQNQKVEQLNQKIDRLKKVDPELAEILADMSTGLGDSPKLSSEEKQRLEQLEQYVAQYEEQRAEEELQREWNALVQEVPAAPQALRSPEWQAWKAAQTPHIRQLAGSHLHKDVVTALNLFAMDMAKMMGVDINAAPAAPAHDPDADKKATDAAKLKEERDRKLKTSTPASARTPVESLQEPDMEKLFEAAFNRTLKERNLI